MHFGNSYGNKWKETLHEWFDSVWCDLSNENRGETKKKTQFADVFLLFNFNWYETVRIFDIVEGKINKIKRVDKKFKSTIANEHVLETKQLYICIRQFREREAEMQKGNI